MLLGNHLVIRVLECEVGCESIGLAVEGFVPEVNEFSIFSSDVKFNGGEFIFTEPISGLRLIFFLTNLLAIVATVFTGAFFVSSHEFSAFD